MQLYIHVYYNIFCEGRRPSRGTKGAGAADELVLARFQAGI